jgi:serine/threonine protein kinase
MINSLLPKSLCTGMSSHRSEAVSLARSKSSQDPPKTDLGKKRKRNLDQPSDVESCITTLLKRVPDVDKHFDIIDILGDGTFSYVFHGKPRNVAVDTSFALKYIIPTSASWRITNEIKYLKRLGGRHHVCDIKCIIRCQDNIVLVLPYFSTTKFLRVVQDANQIEIQR